MENGKFKKFKRFFSRFQTSAIAFKLTVKYTFSSIYILLEVRENDTALVKQPVIMEPFTAM